MTHLVKIEEANSYFSKRFDIICERFSYQFTYTVIDNETKETVETVDNLKDSDLDSVRDELVMKYLLLWAK